MTEEPGVLQSMVAAKSWTQLKSEQQDGKNGLKSFVSLISQIIRVLRIKVF